MIYLNSTIQKPKTVVVVVVDDDDDTTQQCLPPMHSKIPGYFLNIIRNIYISYQK